MVKAFVTGATGLVGSHLVERLIKRGNTVRVLVRPSSQTGFLVEQGVECLPGDLVNLARLAEMTQDVDIIYHCAARPPLGGTSQEFYRDNVEGTANLLEAGRQAGVDRFVHVSTVDVYGYSHHDGTNERAPFKADGLYSWSKIEAERMVMRYYQRHEMPISVIRPCLIYGSRDRHLLPTVLQLVTHKYTPLVCGGHVLLDLVYAGDVAEALCLAGANRAAIGQAYNITDGARHTLREVVHACAHAVGQAPQYLSIPYSLAYAMAMLVSGLSSWLKFSTLPVLRWEVIKAMGHHRHFDISKAAEELGYQPQVSLGVGLPLTLKWYRSQMPQAVRQS
ncbi:MAG: hypothetical protein A2Z21_03960 [Candidatus Fraserbacteria bacterium RBG_16_55_9]|uniref:NAD-dependent epimerase/dehydratase domain-containing protein n=1 Tax=Fraserbacteria sp. (strain RBG_16_55_9) TaxID=1817864 RepID=A0A1F5UYR1_FRAXR|nr:MAG: hypothetical protein A2Z21_03960 [Candidatus Fraserbacteria bacterium RBG_16_55_9]